MIRCVATAKDVRDPIEPIESESNDPLISPRSSRSWFTIEAIDAETYSLAEYGQWLKLHSYLLIGAERAALIDSGLGIGNLRSVVESLTKLPIIVLSTHAHWDHIGCHAQFTDRRVHRAEADWLSEGYLAERREIQDYLTERPFTQAPPPGFRLQDYAISPCDATGFLEDEELIDLGGRTLTCLHTPGHSPGHLCFLDQQRGLLATGDLIYQGILLAGLEHSNANHYRKSLERIRSLSRIKQLLPGHGRLKIGIDLLNEASEAFETLNRAGKLERGAGLHSFDRILVQL